jgi:hypothetical protein
MYADNGFFGILSGSTFYNLNFGSDSSVFCLLALEDWLLLAPLLSCFLLEGI